MEASRNERYTIEAEDELIAIEQMEDEIEKIKKKIFQKEVENSKKAT